MPKRKHSLLKKKASKDVKNINYKELLLTALIKNKINFLLGLITVIVILIVGYNFFLKNKISILNIKPKQITKTTSISKEKEEKKTEAKKYIVKEGDTLWKIAEEFYGSGYNAYDIAIANQINNPDMLYKNQILIIPQVKPKSPTSGQISSVKTEKVNQTTKKYVVKPGDYLWKIALENYGDGYLWEKIAKLNNLSNPNIIEPGQTLILP